MTQKQEANIKRSICSAKQVISGPTAPSNSVSCYYKLAVDNVNGDLYYRLPDGTWQLYLGGGGGGSTTFLGLTDTPNSYTGFNGFVPIVNNIETGLEFVDIISMFGDYIPLAGTEINKPVTGNIEFLYPGSEALSSMIITYSSNAEDIDWGINITRDYIAENHRESKLDAKGLINIDGAVSTMYTALGLFGDNAGSTQNLRVFPDGLYVESNPFTSKGLVGVEDYSPNYDDLTYVQKIYVDTLFNSVSGQNLQQVTDIGNSTTNDIEISDFTKGIVLRSPNNLRWRITVDNFGILTTTQI